MIEKTLSFIRIPLALAAEPDTVDDVLSKIKSEIIVPVISLLFALALVYFLWGVVQFVMNLNSPGDRETGQKHMFWGVIGLAIMLSAFGIVNFVFNTVTDNGKTKGIGDTTIEKPDIIDSTKGGNKF